MAENRTSRTIEPVHQSVAKLLGSQHTFQAPRYQRNYAWGWTEITSFLRDLDRCVKLRIAKENSRHHFFGGLVTVEAKVAGSSRTNLQVVDGQQRLATFAMLISQLKHALFQLAEQLTDADLQQTLRKRAQLLQDQYEIFPDEIRLQNIDVPRIQLSDPDQPFFASLLAGEATKADRKSHELLLAAYDQIGKYLQELVQEAGGDLASAAERLHHVHEVLRSDWTIIHMAAGDKADAYMLFQVLNDRGLSLTEGELLRSATLELLDGAVGLPDLNEAEACWNDMLGGDTLVVKSALSGLYASQVGQWPSKSTLLDDYMVAFFPVTVGVTTLDARAAAELIHQIRSLKDDFDRVKSMSAGDWPIAQSPAVNQWKRNRLRLLIQHLRYMDAIPLLVSACQLKDADFANVVRLLERFAFRYTVMCDGNRGKALELLNGYAVIIRRSPTAFRFADLRRDLLDLVETYASDDTFGQALTNLRYSRTEATNKPLKYLLMTLEDFVRWHAEGGQGSPICRDETRVLDFETGTIEHVYAENTEPPDNSLLPLLDSLGNLTYLSSPENDAAGAKPFEKKRPYFQKSSSLLNQKIGENATWTPAIVEGRTQALVAMAIKIFSI